MRFRVYISGPLTGLENPEALKGFYEDIGGICKELGLDPYIPHKHTDPQLNPDLSPEEVFKRDKEEVRKSDLVIAYVGKPSLGVGMELAYSEVMGIGVILLAEENAKVSRFALGLPNLRAVIRFRDKREALEALREKLREILNLR